MGINSKLKTAALALLLVSVTTIIAASVTPTLISWTNSWEQGYAASFDFSVKFDGGMGELPPGSSSKTVSGNTITITVYYDGGEPKSFDWTSTYPISAVIVKNGAIVPGGGPVAFLYVYDPPVTSDTNLYAPENKGISHVVFCWNRPPEVFPEFPLTPEAIAALGLVAWIAVRRRQKH
jgi:hypothetical protein